jgi:copper(I)-binding protein
MTQSKLFNAVAAAAFAATSVLAQAQAEPSLKVTDAWTKPSIPGASVAAAYLTITSGKPLKLVKAESPFAKTVEIHNMSMKDGVMEMRAVDAIEIPSNTTVSLKPGGYHIMMIKIAKPVKSGDAVPLKLTFESADKKTFSVNVAAKAQDRGGVSTMH